VKEWDLGHQIFYFGRKSKFGLNLQGTCDADGRFLDVSIDSPGATSDYLAFSHSSLFHKLERKGFLAPGLALFGDNAYVNCQYMVTPYKAAKSGSKDNYNFYQSQVRISIECCFGMLSCRWGLLRKAFPAGFGMPKTTALVLTLCRLHNFCITERLMKKNGSSLPENLATDDLNLTLGGAVPLVSVRMEAHPTGYHKHSPEQLLHGGDHFDDVDRRIHINIESRAKDDGPLPRDELHDLVANKGLVRPPLNRY